MFELIGNTLLTGVVLRHTLRGVFDLHNNSPAKLYSAHCHLYNNGVGEGGAL